MLQQHSYRRRVYIIIIIIIFSTEIFVRHNATKYLFRVVHAYIIIINVYYTRACTTGLSISSEEKTQYIDPQYYTTKK